MKKRIVALLLALCIVCMCGLLASCSQLTTVVELAQAVERTNNLEDMDATLEVEMSMEIMGIEMNIPITADMKVKGMNSENPISFSTVSMSLLGTNVTVDVYQEGDWAYLSMDGMQYKMNISEAESEYDYTDDMKNMLQTLPEYLLEGIEFTENEDGSKTISVNISDEEFTELYDELLEDLSATSGVNPEDLEVSDAVVSITIKDGYVLEYDMEFTMAMTVEGVETDTDVAYKLTYNNPGQAVTITPPEGYQDFEEMELTA